MNFSVPFLTIFVSLFIPGIISGMKSKFCGKKSPSLLQPLFDAIRLFKKGSVYSSTSTIIFQIAPLIYLSTVITALLFLPLGQTKGVFSFEYDFVYFAYILALGKFMMILGALDTGSGFEGMGANREALYSMLIEPAFFILIGALALLTRHTSFQEMFVFCNTKGYLLYFIKALGIYLLLQIAMIENSRLLIDDPKTHLELTMVHEVMVLDNSGFDLSLIHIASWLKFGIYSALITNFLLLPSFSFGMQAAIFIIVAIIFSVMVAFLESFRARNKIAVNPAWILAFSSISLVIFLAVVFLVNSR